MLVRLIVLFVLATGSSHVDAVSKDTNKWWTDGFIYQIYPRSFKDSNGDGIGDLNGITSKLEHLADLNVSALWISPIYASPMADFGYDIANFTDIDPIFGNINDFTKLTAKAKSLGLKVLLDFVPNHSSNEHPWFKKSIQKVKPYDEYYVWRDAKIVNGTRQPPNNWLSRFGKSAWEWNAQRGQYYLHQFVIGQPDLNYRSKALDLEMKNALTFWLDRGVDGFRVDAINFMFEDSRFLDEPPAVGGPSVPSDEWEFLNHLYTQDQNETYDVVQSWRALLDAHANRTKTGAKILLTEGYTALPLVMKYYLYGVDAPMNFMFMSDLTNDSRAVDFKRNIDAWMNGMPEGSLANWVVGNHDNHRAASRFGTKRADQLSMLAAVLPGIGIIYNGDEIGMEDMWLSWNDTVDPAGCNAGPSRYDLKSRDPERTPYQWDTTMSAGFSSSNKTWLPVNPNYKTLNLETQKKSSVSHYSIFKELVALKKRPILRDGTTEVILVTENVLGVVRRLPNSVPLALLINFSESTVKVDASAWLNIPKQMVAHITSLDSKIPAHSTIDTSAFNLPGAASVILY
ncbi:alpha-glucosidase-like [Venturia canescens]|uniref:alpha-glucosidase-like n=1 Tax=Venturia canescens TaxID=32260 RepID=UPI001C9CF797|nr:alpha-glucosidase-like [Venturia canescens]